MASRRLQQLLLYAGLVLTTGGIFWAAHNRSLIFASTSAASRILLDSSSRSLSALRQLSSSPAVTQIVHQSWKTRQLPTKRAERWSATWKSCYPNWEWRLWTDEENLALVRDHYSWFLPVYQGQRWPVERADLARYCYMHRHGGIYADLDTICVRNFTDLLAAAALTFGGMDDDRDDGVLHTMVQNSFMASRSPGHPFWLRLLRRIERNFKAGKRGRPEDLTGPNVLMEELREYVKSNATDARIYPGKFFNPFSWKLKRSSPASCKDFGRMTDADERACVASFPDAYVVQVHTQSWGSGRM